MLAEFGASQRGYFTPTEDEQVRHLLVSYWQSRNALAEVVHGLLQSARTPEGAGPATFLIAFAGALVLVDVRVGLKESDIAALKVLDDAAVATRVVLTKADKAKPSELAEQEAAIGRVLKKHPAAFPGVVATSAEKGIGLPELRADLADLAR